MRLLTGAVFLVVLLALAAAAIPRGIADLQTFFAREALLRPDPKLTREAFQERWTHGRNGLERAIALDSRNPNHHENLARWYERAALRMPARNPAAEGYLGQALAHLRTALVARPGSPYTWSNIALLKARLPEPDREFESALRNAALLGPWEPEVQIALADAGFQHWGALGPETRIALNANALRAMRRQDTKLFDLARQRGRLDVLCAVRGVERSRLARACI